MSSRFLVPILGLFALLIPPISGMTTLASRPKSDEQSTVRQRVYVNMPDLPRPTLMKAATDVIRGHVVGIRSVFPENGIGYTDIDFALAWSLAGAEDAQLTVRFPGANDGTNVTLVEGAPQVFYGNDVIALIDRDDEEGLVSLLGMDRGFYQVSVDDSGIETVRGTDGSSVPMDQFVSDLSSDWESSRGGR